MGPVIGAGILRVLTAAHWGAKCAEVYRRGHGGGEYFRGAKPTVRRLQGEAAGEYEGEEENGFHGSRELHAHLSAVPRDGQPP